MRYQEIYSLFLVCSPIMVRNKFSGFKPSIPQLHVHMYIVHVPWRADITYQYKSLNTIIMTNGQIYTSSFNPHILHIALPVRQSHLHVLKVL